MGRLPQTQAHPDITNWQTNCQNQTTPIQRSLHVDSTVWLWDMVTQCSANQKLHVLARSCYRIMLGIVQSESHITNKQLYSMTGAEPVSTTIRQHQLQFVGHCLRMPPDEPANIYALNSSNNTNAQNKGEPKRTYVDQISDCVIQDKMIKLSAKEIIKYAKSKSDWERIVAAPQKPDRWWWWW